ncbi:unnamed protein product, partial [Rotaria magnacalcarata]
TDEEVAKVLDEILAGKLGQLPSVVVGGTVVKENERAVAATADVDSEEDEMERRLQALRS